MSSSLDRGGSASLSSMRWAAVVALLSMLAQAWSLTGYFQADDYLHLYELSAVPFGRLLVTTYSGHLLYTFHFALALLHAVFGFHPTGYFALILLTHGLNAALLCRVVQRFTGVGIAAFVAALWGTTPVQQGAVGFISVYGHVLAVTCLLAALALLMRFFEHGERSALAGSFIFVLLGVGGFGVGIAAASVFPIVAWLLAPGRRSAWRAAAWLAPLWMIPIAYLLSVDVREGAYHGVHPLPALRLAAQYAAYGLAVLLFGAFATLDAQLRAGWPLWGISQDAIVQVGSALWLPFAALLAWTLWRGRVAERGAIAAGLLWAAAAYAIIALGRASIMWGALFPPTTPRYQYLPLTGVALALGSGLACVARRLRSYSWYGSAARVSAAYVLLLAIASPFVGRNMWNRWLDTRGVVQRYAQFFSWAPAHASNADVFVRNEEFAPTRAVIYANGKSARFPGLAAFFATLYPSNRVDGRQVYFVESDADLLAELRAADNQRMHALLIGEDEAERRGATAVSFADFQKASAAPAPRPRR